MKKIFVIALVTLVILVSNSVIATISSPDIQGGGNNGITEQILSDNTECILVDGVYEHDGGGDDPQHAGSISGTVFGTNGWGLIPLILAPVTAGSRTTVTGPGGGYYMGNFAYGTYTVSASYPGYTSESYSVTLTAENPHATADFILQRNGGGGGFNCACVDAYGQLLLDNNDDVIK